MPVVRDFLNLLWSLVALVFLVACVVALYDWVCDNLDVVRMAEQEACADEAPGCRATMTLLMRTPFTQSFEFATGRRPHVHVACKREWILIGAYKCTALDAAPGDAQPASAPSAPVRKPPAPTRPGAPGR
jgi:hypothetical protein